MWVDRRRIFVWIWPISAILVIGLTVWSAIFPFHIYFGGEGVGATESKKFTVSAIFIVIAIGGLYACFGIYQMFFIELRRKFIVSKVVSLGKRYYLKGYYFKKVEFDGGDVLSVEPYNVRTGLGRGRVIATLLAKTPQTKTPNYRVILKDGREFYLPAEMADVEWLVRELRGFVKNTTP